MALFEYTEDTGTSIRTGIFESLSKEMAIKQLTDKGIRLLKIDELNETQQNIHRRLERLKKMKKYLES